MCGLLGMIANDPAPLEPEELRAVMGHRGPDGVGVRTVSMAGKTAVLGHVRLSILDVSEAGAQPMASQNGRWLVSYNGEIYNHADLRRELPGPFRSSCDTETLIEALSQWGIDETVARLNGIFAFLALDLVTGKVYLARDRFGVKPLYFQATPDGIAFASEIRGLELLTGKPYDVDRAGLGAFLTYRYTPSPGTLWAGVSRVKPGHVVSYDVPTGEWGACCYVKARKARFSGSEAEAVKCYSELLAGAVRRQLVSDVPVGVLLSGGIDSSMVAALAVKAGARPTAFTVGFGASHPECEIEYARQTADILGLRHRIVHIDADMAWDAIVPALSHAEEPLGTTSILPMWYLSALAREEVSVVLTGQGTDELFGGYRRYQGELLASFLPRGAIWRPLASLASSFGPHGDVLARAFRGLSARDEALHMTAVHAMFTDRECRALGMEPDNAIRLAPLQDWLDWMGEGICDPAERMMTADLRMNLADDLLLYGDRISMAHSIEARVPMLDNEVVAFVESLPRHMRLRWRHAKYLHRLVARDLLPSSIIKRRKLGFEMPFGTWVRGEWRDRIEAQLFNGKGLERLLDMRGVREIWDQHQNRSRDRTRQLFALLALSLWAETWLENS